MPRRSLTHLGARGRPTMVDVGAKEVTHRVAVAEARVRLPRETIGKSCCKTGLADSSLA